MAAYRRVCDSHHLQTDCQEPGSAPNPAAIEYGIPLLFYCSRNDEDLLLSTYRRDVVRRSEKVTP